MAKLLTAEEWHKMLPTLKYILSDCDGVLWNGENPIKGACECFTKLRALDKKICYVTNNSTKTRQDTMDHCRRLNFVADLKDTYCTAYGTAAHLKTHGVKRVYLIGSKALRHEIVEQGIECNELGPDLAASNWDLLKSIELGKSVDAVVVGYDAHFSMAKVCRAASHLLNPHCQFVATNEDQWLPTERKDIIVPGTGCIVASVQVAANRSPTVIGKPHSPLVELLRREHPDMTPENALFIGDRLNTDIELGRRQGFRTLLVETGVHKRTDIDPERPPTYYAASLNDVLGFMS